MENTEKNNGINWEAWGFTIEDIPRRKIITASPYDIGSYSYENVKDAGKMLRKPAHYAWLSLLRKVKEEGAVLCEGWYDYHNFEKWYDSHKYDFNGEEVFLSRIMYKEYDIINYRLLRTFDINVEYLNNILKDFNVPIDENKYNINIRSLNNIDTSNKLTYLNVDNFSNFLIETSKLIAKYLKEVKKDEYKLSLSNHCTRK